MTTLYRYKTIRRPIKTFCLDCEIYRAIFNSIRAAITAEIKSFPFKEQINLLTLTLFSCYKY